MTTRARSGDSEETVHTEQPAKATRYGLSKRPWRRHVTPWDRILNHQYPGAGTNDDPYIVDWITDSSSQENEKGAIGDAENPMTWSQAYKWMVVACVAIATLAVAMASSTL